MDTAPPVRSALASNANVTVRVLDMLIDDDDETVRTAALRQADET